MHFSPTMEMDGMPTPTIVGAAEVIQEAQNNWIYQKLPYETSKSIQTVKINK